MTSAFSLTSSSSSCHLRLRFQPCHRFILFVLLYLAIHVFTFESCWKCRANPVSFSSTSLVNVVLSKDSVEGTKSPVSSSSSYSSSYPSSAEKSRHTVSLTGHPVLVYNMSSSLLRRNTQRNNGRRQQEQDTGRNACRECLLHVIFLLLSFLYSCDSGETDRERTSIEEKKDVQSCCCPPPPSRFHSVSIFLSLSLSCIFLSFPPRTVIEGNQI